MRASKKWFIGTSGFMVSQPLWLSLPGLNCIEVNSTFYRLPSAKTIDRWKNLSPNLYFSLKASRYITHIKRLKDCEKPWKLFWSRAKLLGEKLRAVLIQLPPSFKNNEETIERVKAMGSYLPKGGPTIVFEFRDKSWFTDQVNSVMRENGWCLGGTAIRRPTKRYWLGNLPSGIHIPPKTNDATYIRIHGEKGYKGYYTPQQLANLKRLVERNGTKKNFVMFNNTFFARRGRTCKVGDKKIRYAAVCDAVKFDSIIRKRRRTRKTRRP